MEIGHLSRGQVGLGNCCILKSFLEVTVYFGLLKAQEVLQYRKVLNLAFPQRGEYGTLFSWHMYSYPVAICSDGTNFGNSDLE